MQEKRLYILQVDETFKKLIPPLDLNEYKQLEENLLKDGCREPLCVWGNIIIDGHNRYEICTKLQIPFYIQQIDFNNKEEVITWICANQLGRRNISDETRKYLIGKRYEIEKIIKRKNKLGRNQYSIDNIDDNNSQESMRTTSERLGQEYQLAGATVRKYANFAKSLDILARKDSALISKILTGKIKISQKNISKLSKQSHKVIDEVRNQLNNSNDNFITYSSARKVIPVKREKITVKNMPEYDPDAEISSLAFTIPSWIKSIDRTLAFSNLSKTSENAKEKLKNELRKLEYTTNIMLLALEEA